jgi:hypothetical protein
MHVICKIYVNSNQVDAAGSSLKRRDRVLTIPFSQFSSRTFASGDD